MSRLRLLTALLVIIISSSLARAQQQPPPAAAGQPTAGQAPAGTVRIALKPIRPYAVPRTLLGRSVTKLPNGQSITQELWGWTIPGTPKLTQPKVVDKQAGRVRVHRTYTPEGDHTKVEQVTLVMPAQPRVATTEAEKATVSLNRVLGMVKEGYVEPVDEAKMLRDAMRGVAHGLDKHTMYFDPDQWQSFRAQLADTTVGIGIKMKFNKKSSGLFIQSVVRGGPAAHAGVRSGDKIVAVEGAALGSTPEQAFKAMKGVKGDAGSMVRITVERGGQSLELPIVRGAIDLGPVQTRLTPEGVGVVRLPHFGDKAAEKVAKAVDKLSARNGGQLRGLVLDLRNNPGGALTEATSLLNLFVGQGTLVTTRGRGDVVKESIQADPAKVRWPDLPMAVLVNKNSASASELVSGTLKDLGRATVLGSKSYGKGSVQSVIPLPDGSGIKITMAHYFTAGGQTPDKVGITPNVDQAAAKAGYQARHGANTRGIHDYVLDEAVARLAGPR
jgi:carboxyl-terminal processing protease